jgi:hypothetical protein
MRKLLIILFVSHPVLGKDSHLAEFLERQDPPPRPARLKKGWLAGVKDKWESRNYSAKYITCYFFVIEFSPFFAVTHDLFRMMTIYNAHWNYF